MAEHTSGPWRVGAETAIFGGSDGRIIGQCYGSPGLPPGPAEAVANAHLIAAAPDLLAVLERIVNGATRPMGEDSCGYEYAHIRQTLLDLGRLAIANAKGVRP